MSTPNGAPGTKQQINVRGYTGIAIDANGNKVNRSAGPLVVIDGVQGGDLSSINMNDVASVSVVKDAAAAAIYGSSAPYGVIIITTKRVKQASLLLPIITILVLRNPLIYLNSPTHWTSPTHLMKLEQIPIIQLSYLMMMSSSGLKIIRRGS
ncbi:TonB-dependent receptor plug domain-containing protein [Sphingobacterium sp. E70]|uniref:TonB-dependent receptor plug domain-containing protein n=1 Tax=Sphingobacterium sp. E70 TaxID=2853439 RepID=UPI00211C5F72|nr:TonB-dependent receptor plug domain-containing protein [Sphingobacterium sp. E70]ULT28910.1 TonB-dependent receptor plug domain-containing protein [Sphingobacterium sp. E70]